MSSHYQLSDLEFKKQFENCTLDPALFTHEAHLRLAWIDIKIYGLEKAIPTISDQIINFANSLGVKDKFNKTITVAAMKAVYHFMQKSNAATFENFISEFPRLKNNFKELLAFHYSFDIFNLPEAKKEFLEPDLLPFD